MPYLPLFLTNTPKSLPGLTTLSELTNHREIPIRPDLDSQSLDEIPLFI
ncbi:hypothetical protein VIBNISOn1_650005 [Vibrio nigripulchritudo SOn1]|uniref:Uncharacterized protein n=1 Tax=Vibrio nigripulchritudo SOn1 TaxID=1238450 RepID=A0AAV2VW41_9VIBR|nr:hypothetical protein VIBNISFn118_1860025 [Vibrio nigripulchritudo SFn118]CCO48831.1 hypothetical protein VIBNISOn1_650005 [Vibrio nigripulchritudo SOn1]